MPVTLAVPTVVPPVQLVGAVDSGPKTVKVIVPDGLMPEASAELIVLEAMAVPMVPDDGPVAVRVGTALEMVVSDMAEPQLLVAALLFESPP